MLKSWLFIIVKFPQIQYDVYYGTHDFIHKFTISECFILTLVCFVSYC